jgi:hypothetical protein
MSYPCTIDIEINSPKLLERGVYHLLYTVLFGNVDVHRKWPVTGIFGIFFAFFASFVSSLLIDICEDDGFDSSFC